MKWSEKAETNRYLKTLKLPSLSVMAVENEPVERG